MNIQKILNKLKNLAFRILNKLGFQVLKNDKYSILEDVGILEALHRWGHSDCPTEIREFVMRNLSYSKSQIQQDLWALHSFMEKHNPEGYGGYFVEFGATDGILRSNTYLLEKHFGWNGILSEPAQSYEERLRRNRSVAIDTRCVYSESGKTVTFHEVESMELSGISDFKHIGGWEEERRNFKEYSVETISLNDLLVEKKAPKVINYISVDTEGSEFEILSSFPFDKWDVECFSIEHNFSENEEKLDSLMQSNGYRRVLRNISSLDGWYVR